MSTPKLRPTLSRASYRQHVSYKKTREQKTKTDYLRAKLIQKADNSNEHMQKLSKQFDMYHPIYNPQAFENNDSSTKFKISGDMKQDHNLNTSGEQIMGQARTQIQASEINKYQIQFIQKNNIKNASFKVEREKINIESENYRVIINICLKNIHEIVDQFLQSLKQLENKYCKGHEIFKQMSHLMEQKRIKERNINTSINIQKLTMKLDNLTKKTQKLKQQQVNMQNNIKKVYIKLKKILKDRNNFIKYLLKQGYYQQNGLIWIFQQAFKIQQFDEQIEYKYKQQCKRVGLKVYQNIFQHSIQQLNIDELTNHLPSILDIKSRQYLLRIYNRIKQNKKQEEKEETKKILRMKTNMQKSDKKQYIIDTQPEIFSNSTSRYGASNSNSNTLFNNILNSHKYSLSHEQNRDMLSFKNNPSILVTRTQDSILQHSNIIGLYKNMQVHTRNQKYNYDIKNIYANTRESLLKWIQGKCKDVVLNKSISKQKDHIAVEEEENLIAGKISTQVSIPFQQSENQIKKQSLEYGNQIKNAINSPIYFKRRSKSPYQKSKDNQGQEQLKAGFSLPVINKKRNKIQSRKLTQKERKPRQLSSATKSAIKKLQKNNNTNKQYKEMDRTEDNRGKKHDRKEQMMNQTLPEKMQQIRILRIYKKQDQQIVLKYLFGIKIKRQVLIRILFYQ